MVPADFPFEIRTWWQKSIVVLLGEVWLGFLAIMAVALAMLPNFFELDSPTNNLIEATQWIIVTFFIVEYGLGLTCAANKKAFLVNPWRLLDFLTIVISLVTLLPSVSKMLRSSLALRLLRLARILTFGLRASGIVVREDARRAVAAPVGPVEVSVLNDQAAHPPQAATWAEFLKWPKSADQLWYHVANLGADQLRDMASAFRIPPAYVESHLFGASYPHIEMTDRYMALFVWLPEVQPSASTERNGLLLLGSERGLLSLSRRRTDLLKTVAAMPSSAKLAAIPFSMRMTWAFLRAVLNRNEELVGRFERELRALEDLPVRESRPQFFEQTFRLKKELSTAQSDLWRLKGVLTALAESRVKLPGSSAESEEAYRNLAEDADYLYETVANTREGLLSLIDLHLNVVSFEMNRVMRVLAVVSVLGLIPAVVGGLFGMNLKDNPWPFTLPQVAFGVCMGMVLTLYLFLAKGWLR